MTPQEASEELKEEFEIFKNCIKKSDWENPDEELRKIIEANSMAIEILGQQPCDDCVSREALRNLKVSVPIAPVFTDDNRIKYRDVVFYDDIIDLQSVIPKQETGEWIPLNYKDEMWRYVYKCSNCGATEYKDNFCPNCGIRMIEPRESEIKDDTEL